VAVPACLRLADEVFPRVRALAARRLVAAGWSQSRAGAALGLSQAMVSRHLSAPAPADPVAARLADDLVESLLHPVPARGPSDWCGTLTIGHEKAGGGEALQDLLAAERLLRDANPLAVMPQVGLNLARAIPGASSPDDVLAFPGRLVEAGGRIVSPAAPAFGGSGHLARVLLARRFAGGAGAADLALANVRGGAEMLAAAHRLGWPSAAVARGRASAGTGSAAEAPVLKAARGSASAVVLHDPGAVGLEPCLYVAGRTAVEVAERILQLQDSLVTA
jgi:predicted fused transcriptional regulator/phosphomethylpyrimidine kinase